MSNILAHIPVMVRESLSYCVGDGIERVLDMTYGDGGHSRELLSSGLKVLAFDRDPASWAKALHLEEKYGKERFQFKQAKFSEVGEELDGLEIVEVDAILADLGVSTEQILSSRRGFSFMNDGPLDMRMGQDTQEMSAADFINKADANIIETVLKEYGDERNASMIANSIVRERKLRPFTSTRQLAELVRKNTKAHKKDAATKTFLALRILVNHEVDELHSLLRLISSKLRIGGYVVIICFNSLEHKIVKSFFRKNSIKKRLKIEEDEAQEEISCEGKVGGLVSESRFVYLTPSPLRPCREEIESNRRTRSAMMHVARKERDV